MMAKEAKKHSRAPYAASAIHTSMAQICQALQECGASDQEAAFILVRWIARGWLRIKARPGNSGPKATLRLDTCRAA